MIDFISFNVPKPGVVRISFSTDLKIEIAKVFFCSGEFLYLKIFNDVNCLRFDLMVYDEPVSKIALCCDDTSDIVILDELFCSNDNQYHDRFRLKKTRPSYKEIIYFISYQHARFYPGKSCYKIGSSVIECYKACEIGNEEVVADALNSLLNNYSLLSYCEFNRSPRTNREHLYASMLCAEAHARIFLKDKNGLSAVFSKAKALSKEIINMMTPAYPLSLVLLLCNVYYASQGRTSKSNETLNDIFYVYQRAVSDMSLNSPEAWIRELNISHSALCHSISIQKKLKNKCLSDDFFYEPLKFALRTDSLSLERMVSNFKCIMS